MDLKKHIKTVDILEKPNHITPIILSIFIGHSQNFFPNPNKIQSVIWCQYIIIIAPSNYMLMVDISIITKNWCKVFCLQVYCLMKKSKTFGDFFSGINFAFVLPFCIFFLFWKTCIYTRGRDRFLEKSRTHIFHIEIILQSEGVCM